jgi:bla regulator protein BlaR1
MGLVLDHLWQSTLFGVVAAALAWALRGHQARTRYVVWLVASAKFLLPYAALVAAARLIPWPGIATPAIRSSTPFLDTADAISAPFSAASSPGVHPLATSHIPWLTVIVAGVWLTGTMTLAIRWMVLSRRLRLANQPQAPGSDRERDVLLRIAEQTATSGVDVRLVDSGVEPGVAGVLKPVLYWPRGLAERLTDEQLDAVVTHEMAHVRWHDNTAAIAHMAVEALFWFHPLVWWLGARLIDERERACDEAVLRAGRGRHAYAEGILRICEFYIASPVSCVSGVSGADLRRRMELIMGGQVGHVLQRRNAWLVASVLALTLSVPVGVAAWRSTQAPERSVFEAASIKPNTSASMSMRCCWDPGGLFVGVNITAEALISGGYPTKVRELIGAPDWLSRDRFDVTARAGFDPTSEERQQMVRALLADRFKLAVHYQSEERPVYSLDFARADKRLGSKLKAIDTRCDLFKPLGQAPKRLTYDEAPCSFRMNAGGGGKVTIVSGGRTMDDLGNTLSGLVGRPVIDKTHLAGYYEFSLEYPDEQGGGQLFTALREQFGLKLESTRAPLDVVVIDHIERPTKD